MPIDYSGLPRLRPDYLAAFQHLAECWPARAAASGPGHQALGTLVQVGQGRIVREAAPAAGLP